MDLILRPNIPEVTPPVKAETVTAGRRPSIQRPVPPNRSSNLNLRGQNAKKTRPKGEGAGKANP